MRQVFKFVLVFVIGIALGRLWVAGALRPLAKSIESAAREIIASAGAPDLGPTVVIEVRTSTAILRVAPTGTHVPPTTAPVIPTRTPVPPTAPHVPPTATPITPTLTQVPSTATPIPATQPAYIVERISPAMTRQTRDVVNLRLGPGTSYEKAGTLPANTNLQISGRSGDWYLVDHKGRDAYVAMWLIGDVPTATAIRRPTSVRKPTPSIVLRRFASPEQKYVHGAVNFWQGPGTNYAKTGSVTAGASLQILGRSGDWYLLRHGGREVYIASWLTHDSPPPPARPQQAQQRPAQQQPVQQQPVQQQPVQQQPSYSCNCSKTCGQMSCQEAYFQLNNCGCRRRDHDNDGVPCESVCPGG